MPCRQADILEPFLKASLGRWISKPYDWTPLKGRDTTFDKFNPPDLDRKDPWQFKNFLVTDAG